MADESRVAARRTRVEQPMAELATYPATGPLAWQFRGTRERLGEEIEFAFQAWDIAREIEGSLTTIFDGETTPSG